MASKLRTQSPVFVQKKPHQLFLYVTIYLNVSNYGIMTNSSQIASLCHLLYLQLMTRIRPKVLVNGLYLLATCVDALITIAIIGRLSSFSSLNSSRRLRRFSIILAKATTSSRQAQIYFNFSFLFRSISDSQESCSF